LSVGELVAVSAALRSFWRIQERVINDVVRPALNLAPYPQQGPHALLREQHTPILCAFGSYLGPPSVALPQYVRLTGFWLPAVTDLWEPKPELAAFLASRRPYAYVRVVNADEPANQRGFAALIEAVNRQGLCSVISADCWSSSFLDGLMANGHVQVPDDVPR